MANENLVKFFEMVKSNQSIQNEIVNAVNEEEAIKKAMQLAQEHGLSFTAVDFSTYMSEIPSPNRELSDVELSSVAGGLPPNSVSAANAKAVRCAGSGFWCYIYM